MEDSEVERGKERTPYFRYKYNNMYLAAPCEHEQP